MLSWEATYRHYISERVHIKGLQLSLRCPSLLGNRGEKLIFNRHLKQRTNTSSVPWPNSIHMSSSIKPVLYVISLMLNSPEHGKT